MTLSELLISLTKHGIELELNGDSLRIRAPKGALTPELRTTLADRKAELMAFLRQANGVSEDVAPLASVPRDEPLPLSFAQEEIWTAEQFAGGEPIFTLSCAFHISGDLEPARLERCLNTIIAGHEALRTTFQVVDGKPVQIIHPARAMALPIIELPHSDGSVAERVRHYLEHHPEPPFDLVHGPLLRSRLFRLSQTEHVLHLATHHIIFDAWSIGCVMRELAALYPLPGEQHSPAPAAARIQPVDVAVAQRSSLQLGQLEAQLAYWHQRLAGAPALLNLPTDRPRCATMTAPRKRTTFRVDADILGRLQQLSRAEGATLFTTLLAAFNVLLWRYAEQDDLLVGTPTSGRTRPETQHMIASFAYPIVIRSRVKGNPSFRTFLKEVRDVVLEAQAHQDVTFANVVEAVKPARVSGANTLFQVMFSYPAPMPPVIAETITISHVQDLLDVSSVYDIALGITEEKNELDGLFVYTPQLFDDFTIQQMAVQFVQLLSVIAHNADCPIAAIPIEGAAQPTLSPQQTQAKLGLPDNTLAEQLMRRMLHNPAAIALVEAGQQLSYGQLQQRVGALCDTLRQRGVGRASCVGLCAEPSISTAVALLALIEVGASIVPFAANDPIEWQEALVQALGVEFVLSETMLPRYNTFGAAPVLPLDQLTATDTLLSRNTTSADYPQNGENCPRLMLQHGKTGRILDQADILAQIDWLQETIGASPEDAVLYRTPHVNDQFIAELLWPLLAGARVVIPSRNPQHLGEVISATQATVVFADQADIDSLATHSSADAALTAVRVLVCVNGSLKAASLLAQGGDRYELIRHPAIPTPLLLRRSSADRQPEQGKHFTIANPSIAVVDRYGNLAPHGVRGELCVARDAVVYGYRQMVGVQPGNTVEIDDTQFLRLGLKVRRVAAGQVELREPARFYTWRQGRSVDTTVIEQTLRSEALIHDCAVCIRAGETGNSAIIAYITSPGTVNIEQLRATLQAKLPAAYMPDHLIQISTLPLSAAGDIDYQALMLVPVLDQDVRSTYESQLQTQLASKDIAVVLGRSAEALPQLRISDLLPAPKSKPAAAGQGTLAPTAVDGAGRPALRHGDELRRSPLDPRLLHDTLAAAARTFPQHGATYITTTGGTIVQSYPELLDEAERVLASLRAQGLSAQDLVLFQLDQNQDFIPALWGCILGGFVPVPLATAAAYNEMNAAVSKLQHTWEMLNKPLLITTQGLAPQIAAMAQMLGLEGFRYAVIEELRHAAPDHNWHQSEPSDLALLMLTSGSTGRPKGVMLNHANLIDRALGSRQMNGFTAEDISLNWMPLDHVAGLIYFHLRDVFLGSQQVHLPTQLVLQDPLCWLDWLERCRATVTFAPNFAFGLINSRADEISRRSWDLSALRYVLNGAEAIVPKTARRFLQVLAPHGLKPHVMTPAWGMSETSSGCVYSHSFRLDTSSDDDSFVEVGDPIPGLSFRIVDSENRVLEEGTVGQLQVRGLTVTSGYYGNPLLNQTVFTADGWFNTGDQAVIRNGRLTITGREKDDIVINSVNYYSHDIESVVEGIGGIEPSYTAACAVRGSDSNTDQLAIFFNTTHNDTQIPELMREIRRSVVRKIGVNPEYLIPVQKSDIPKTSIGKIQRSQLSKRFMDGEFEAILRRFKPENTVPAWFYHPIWRPKAANQRTPSAKLVVIFADEGGIGSAVCDLLRAQGFRYVEVFPGSAFARRNTEQYSIDPANPQHYHELLTSLSAELGKPDHVIHLWTCEATRDNPADATQLAATQDYGAYSLLATAQALDAAQCRPANLLAVSQASQPVRDGEAIAYTTATLIGLVKTLGQEMPWLDCRHVDLPAGAQPGDAELVLRELWADPSDPEVAYRDGARYIPRLMPLDFTQSPPQATAIKAEGMYLITGGLGDIGVELARSLLRQYRARLLIVGRTPLPPVEDWVPSPADETTARRVAAYRELEQIGTGKIAYHALDLCDATAIAAAVDAQCRIWNCPLDGIIHIAGVYQERTLSEETPETLAATFQTKLMGTWALHHALAERNPLFIYISSVNSFFGGIGAGAYAAAHRFVEHFAHFQRSNGLDARCLVWSMWDGVGVSRHYAMKAISAARGYMQIEPRLALQSWHIAMHQPHAQIFIGLDATKTGVASAMELAPRSNQQLAVYLSEELRPVLRGRPDLAPSDRFGTPVPCEYIGVSQLPRTSDGSIDYAQLAALQPSAAGKQQAHVPPKTDLERAIAAIWQEVLKIEHVGVNDNVFELGGQSILLAQIYNKLKLIGPNLDIVDLFKYPTISTLASYLSQQSPKEPDSRVATERADSRKAALERQRQQRQKLRTNR